VSATLRKQGETVTHNRVATLITVAGLQGRQARGYRVRRPIAPTNYPIAPKLLSTSNVPIKPDEVWGTEITYLETGKDWLYLTGILDLYSRRFDQAGAWDRAWRLRCH
jgi:transposase InsO family protein